MGLTIGVGWLSQLAAEGEDSGPLREVFSSLNDVLREAGMAEHHEPVDLDASATFEAQMWGYNGLHAVRRLAAYHACEGRLPHQAAYGEYADDPMVERLNQELLRANQERRRGLLARWLNRPRHEPKFEHLLWHSDCEGFYLPSDFDHVVFDNSQPQREGVGCMVGSAVRLLQDCEELARLIDLPDGLHEQSEELWKNAESSPQTGRPWQVLGVEAFGLVCLIRGCKASLITGAALAFG